MNRFKKLIQQFTIRVICNMLMCKNTWFIFCERAEGMRKVGDLLAEGMRKAKSAVCNTAVARVVDQCQWERKLLKAYAFCKGAPWLQDWSLHREWHQRDQAR